jgi:glycosyltransferase involved in cell wall biosynthesis
MEEVLMRVLAFTKYGPLAASMRQRFSQFQPALNAAGIQIDYAPLLRDEHLRRLSRGRRSSPLEVIGYYANRASRLLSARRYDVLWVHCEFFPFMPAFVEKLAVRLAGRPIVFDFDDAIFSMYDHASNYLVRALLSGKLEPLLRAAAACTCGNAYLRDYAARFCSKAIIVPTTVDTDRYRPASNERTGIPVIGWIGSPSTWPYLQPVSGLLEQMVRAGRARVRIVGAGSAAVAQSSCGFEFVDWSEKNEIREIQRMDIGIMPLPDDAWARGKSGYKLIQYMACGLPVIASTVGVNSEIVRHGENGFLAATDDWKPALNSLVSNAELRARMGAEGRRRAVADYSLRAHAPRVVEIVSRAAAAGDTNSESHRLETD